MMIQYLYLLASTQSDIKPVGLPKAGTNADQIQTVLAIVFGIIGGLAFLMIVISGFRYILSSGDPGNISKAKDGIIYALVGLMIALVAESIVAFVGNSL